MKRIMRIKTDFLLSLHSKRKKLREKIRENPFNPHNPRSNNSYKILILKNYLFFDQLARAGNMSDLYAPEIQTRLRESLRRHLQALQAVADHLFQLIH